MQSARDYSSKRYWQERFEEEESFEWLQKPEDICKVLDFFIQRTVPSTEQARVLVIGCGNSTLSAALHDTGNKKVVSTDFSDVVLKRMEELHSANRPDMEWVHCNALDMSCFAANSFDAVIDKSTLDAISCGGLDAVKQATTEIRRVLNAPIGSHPTADDMLDHPWGGIYCLITYTKFRTDDFLEEEASYTARDICTKVAVDRVSPLSNSGALDLNAIRQGFVAPEEAQDSCWHLICALPFYSDEEHDNGSGVLPSNAHYLLVFAPKK